MRFPRLVPIKPTIVLIALLVTVKSVKLLHGDPVRGITGSVDYSLLSSAQAAPEHATEERPAAENTPEHTLVHSKSANASQSNADTAPPVSETERELLIQLRERRKAIEDKEQELQKKRELLATAEQRLASRIEQLTKLQAQLEKLDAARREHDTANWQGLVKTYEAMRPRDAASIMNELDLPTTLQVLDRMKEAKAALILAAMAPDRARTATTELAQMRSRSVSIPAVN